MSARRATKAEDIDPAPEADCAPLCPHPRMTSQLFGQSRAEQAFLAAKANDRMHHAWMITGPRGVGKATLAWRIAAHLLAQNTAADMFDAGPSMFGDDLPTEAPTRLDVPDDHPVRARIRALSDPGLYLLRRPYDDKTQKHASVIPVDEVRKFKSFCALSATDGGWRVAIIDAADDLNTAAANALLKILEEPPAKMVILLVCHRPSALLPTIRSRCRVLTCAPLAGDDMGNALAPLLENDTLDAPKTATPALSELANGSVGDAVRLAHLDGLAIYGEIVAMMGTLPRLDRRRALALAESAAGKANEERYDLILRLMDQFLTRLARASAGKAPVVEAAAGEAQVFARMGQGAADARAWAELQQMLSARVQHGRAVNLDPAALILDMILKITDTAAKLTG